MRKFFNRRLTKKQNITWRMIIFLCASAVILAFSLLAPPTVGLFDMIGMELALVALAIFLCVFPVDVYLAANLFTISAAAGSIIRWYDKFPGYDRVVHFVSGILLAYIGAYIINFVCRRMKIKNAQLLTVIFAGMFAFFGAGFWEIVEFLTDCVMHMEVQHGNVDTMGDIVAGYLGGLVYQIGLIYTYRKYFFSFARIKRFVLGDSIKTPAPVLAEQNKPSALPKKV